MYIALRFIIIQSTKWYKRSLLESSSYLFVEHLLNDFKNSSYIATDSTHLYLKNPKDKTIIYHFSNSIMRNHHTINTGTCDYEFSFLFRNGLQDSLDVSYPLTSNDLFFYNEIQGQWISKNKQDSLSVDIFTIPKTINRYNQ